VVPTPTCRLAEPKGRPNAMTLSMTIGLLLAFALIAYMVFEARTRLEVVERTLHFDRLPPAFDGFRIVMVSDFHAPRFRRWDRRVIDAIGRIDADLLVIGGDLKARNYTPNRPIVEILDALIEATRRYPFRPVYVRGNHDRRGFSAICNRRRDLHALRDRHIALQRNGQRIVVAGVRHSGRVTRRMRSSVRKALRGVDPNDFLIFIAHSPDYFRMAAQRGADLVLSGDTHGGQIRLPILGPLLMSKCKLGGEFDMGHVERFGSQLYVTRGVGSTGPPFRLLCRPEISVLTLKRKN